MPHLYRTPDGQQRKPGQPGVSLTLADGTELTAIWAGSAQEEKLGWWLRKPGSELAQSQEVGEIAVKAEDNNEIAWGAAPAGARIFFVVEAPMQAKKGGTYRLARLVTTAATPAQIAYFRDERFSLFGTFDRDGRISRITPLPAPSCAPPPQGELW